MENIPDWQGFFSQKIAPMRFGMQQLQLQQLSLFVCAQGD